MGVDRRWETLPLGSEDLSVLAELQTFLSDDAPALLPEALRSKPAAALASGHDSLLPQQFDELLQRRLDIEERLLQIDAVLSTLKDAALPLLDGYHQALSSISAHLSFTPSTANTANPLIAPTETYLQPFLELSSLSRAVLNGDARSGQLLESLARCIEHASCLQSKGAAWRESGEAIRLYRNAIAVGRSKIVSFVQKQIALSMEIEASLTGKESVMDVAVHIDGIHSRNALLVEQLAPHTSAISSCAKLDEFADWECRDDYVHYRMSVYAPFLSRISVANEGCLESILRVVERCFCHEHESLCMLSFDRDTKYGFGFYLWPRRLLEWLGNGFHAILSSAAIANKQQVFRRVLTAYEGRSLAYRTLLELLLSAS